MKCHEIHCVALFVVRVSLYDFDELVPSGFFFVIMQLARVPDVTASNFWAGYSNLGFFII